MLTVDLERLGVRSGDWLLDAGCGGGRHCFGAMDRGANAVGLDLDTDSLRLARAGIAERRGAGAPPHGGALRGDVLRLPFRDGVFDRVICSEVMEHVHDYRGAMRELVRVLRRGGSMGVTIPTAPTEHAYLWLTRHYFESPGGHIRIFKPRELALSMADAGLRVEAVGFAHALHAPYWAVRSVVGLDDESVSPTRAYRRFLLRASQSGFWTRVERVLDRVFPKSLILYGTRVATGRA